MHNELRAAPRRSAPRPVWTPLNRLALWHHQSMKPAAVVGSVRRFDCQCSTSIYTDPKTTELTLQSYLPFDIITKLIDNNWRWSWERWRRLTPVFTARRYASAVYAMVVSKSDWCGAGVVIFWSEVQIAFIWCVYIILFVCVYFIFCVCLCDCHKSVFY